MTTNLQTAILAFAATSGSALFALQGPLPPAPSPAANPTTAEKAVLGKMLFWDEQLSSDGSMACGTCHQPGVGGVDPRLTQNPANPGPDGISGTADDIFGSPGIHHSNVFGHVMEDAVFGFDEQVTGRNTPSMIGAAYFDELFWDGRAEGRFTDPLTGLVVIPTGGALESQSLGPIMSDVEMAFESRGWTSVTERIAAAQPLAMASNLPADVLQALASGANYSDLFQDAFGTPNVTPVRIAFALAAYQRTLVPDQTKFDRVMRGQAQFTQAENRGFGAFRSPQSRCNQCHSGSLFSDEDYHNLGLRPITEDNGRQGETGNFGDRGKFKTPSLRNVALRERFFHTGAPGINTLTQLLNFYDDQGGPFNENKDFRLNNLRVPPQVRPDLVAFLNTLTDPRVAAATAPFDHPSLWSQRLAQNPAVTLGNPVAGSGGFVPQLIATAPPKVGNPGFRVAVRGGLGGALSMLRIDVMSLPTVGSFLVGRTAFPRVQVLSGSGAGQGYATWINEQATSPVLVGLQYRASWLVRDPLAAGGVARSEPIIVTIE